MKISSVLTHSLTALAIAGGASMAFAQSNATTSPSTPAPAAANQQPPAVGSTPVTTTKPAMVERKPAPAEKGNNTSSSPASPAPAAANQQPPAVGAATSSNPKPSMAERKPAAGEKGNNTSSSPASPAPAAANPTR